MDRVVLDDDDNGDAKLDALVDKAEKHGEMDGKIYLSKTVAHPFFQETFTLKAALALFAVFELFEIIFVWMSNERDNVHMMLFILDVIMYVGIVCLYYKTMKQELMIMLRAFGAAGEGHTTGVIPSSFISVTLSMLWQLAMTIVEARTGELQLWVIISSQLISIVLIGFALLLVMRREWLFVIDDRRTDD